MGDTPHQDSRQGGEPEHEPEPIPGSPGTTFDLEPGDRRVEKLCKERSFSEGDHIVRQGDEGIGLYVIIDGKVKIVKRLASGKEVEIAEHGPGEFFGEFSVLDGAPRTADVVAVADCTCYVVSSWDFKTLMKSHPEIALEVLPVVIRRFRETNEQLLGLSRV